jgi:hypothetical protein
VPVAAFVMGAAKLLFQLAQNKARANITRLVTGKTCFVAFPSIKIELVVFIG